MPHFIINFGIHKSKFSNSSLNKRKFLKTSIKRFFLFLFLINEDKASVSGKEQIL